MVAGGASHEAEGDEGGGATTVGQALQLTGK